MNHLADHYGLLLGLDASRRVRSVELSLEEDRVDIRLESAGDQSTCSRGAKSCEIADHATERTWRHLDTMQFETRIHARLPRSRCADCGVLTVLIPWADKHSRLTLMFEAFDIEVLRTASTINRAAALLRLDWDSVQTIVRREIERGLSRSAAVPLPKVGMEEKSFLRGPNDVSILTAPDSSRVLEVADGRDAPATDRLWQSLPEDQRQSVEAVDRDMSATYAEGALGGTSLRPRSFTIGSTSRRTSATRSFRSDVRSTPSASKRDTVRSRESVSSGCFGRPTFRIASTR